MSFSKLFKKTSQQRLTLNKSELQILRELASFLLSVNFPGSQLEALLYARASQASILTPFPAAPTTPSPSGSEVDAVAQTIQPPLVPSPADRTASPTREPTPSPQSVPEPVPESHSGPSTSPRLIVEDYSFEGSTIDGTGSSVPLVVENFSHCTETIVPVKSAAFSHANVKDATIYNHSMNGNSDCFNTTSRMSSNVYRY